MNTILKNRVSFIRAMINSVETLSDAGNFPNDAILGLKDLIVQIREDKKNHFLSTSEDVSSQVSYCRNVEDKYNSLKRMRCPLGRYIMRNLDFDKKVVSDHVVSNFVQKVWGNIEFKNIKVDILKGDDIVKAYRAFGDSSAHSCMTGGECEYTKLYALNPAKVSMVIYEELRALLWETDEGAVVFDRIYPAGHGKMEIFRNWARSKGYILRANADRLCDDSIVKLTDDKTYHVTLRHNDVFPYLDTFCYGKMGRKEVVLSNNSRGNDCTFHCQSGGYDGDNSVVCCSCDCNVSEGDSMFVDDSYYCQDCYSETYTTCTDCSCELRRNDCATSSDGDVYCEDCYIEIYCFCTQCGVEISRDDVTLTEDGDGYCDRCADRLITECEECHHNFLRSDTVESLDSDNYCEHCAAKVLVTCNLCEEFCKSSDCNKIGDDFYCEECADEKFLLCAYSGEFIKDEDDVVAVFSLSNLNRVKFVLLEYVDRITTR